MSRNSNLGALSRPWEDKHRIDDARGRGWL